MKRRNFLSNSVPAAVLPFLLGGFNVRAYGRSRVLEGLIGAGVPTDRVLVLIQLNGGNDGLNMVIPRDQYPALTDARSNIVHPREQGARPDRRHRPPPRDDGAEGPLQRRQGAAGA